MVFTCPVKRIFTEANRPYGLAPVVGVLVAVPVRDQSKALPVVERLNDLMQKATGRTAFGLHF